MSACECQTVTPSGVTPCPVPAVIVAEGACATGHPSELNLCARHAAVLKAGTGTYTLCICGLSVSLLVMETRS